MDAVFATMLTEPVATPVTVPAESTRATDGSALVHVTRIFESGFPLTSVTAVRNLSVLRTDTCAVPGLTVTQFGAGGVFDTVTNADTRSLPDAMVICALPRVCALTVPSLSTEAIVESLVLHCWGWPVTSRPVESSIRTASFSVCPGGIVGAAGDTRSHLARECGVSVVDDGSVIVEHPTIVAQLSNASARREINISKVLTGSSGNPTDIMCHAAHLSLVGFASPSFGGFAIVAGREPVRSCRTMG